MSGFFYSAMQKGPGLFLGGMIMKRKYAKDSYWQSLFKNIKVNWILYVMILPVLVYYIIFSYVPMYGIVLAFKKYSIRNGIMGSPWIGLKNFEKFFGTYNFWQLIGNTVGISFYSLIVGFPLPILFALLLNYLRSNRLRKVVQMVSYAPYFISTVVICGMISLFLNVDIGIVNKFLNFFGVESINFLAEAGMFKSVYVWTGIWQHLGWDAIIYISALSGVDQQLHEAAIIDGATKIQRMIHVDLPAIKPTIIMLLILKMGGLMNVGFEKVFLLQNSLNKSASSVISTYIYEVGLINSDYGYSTAVGLFNSVINAFLLITVNTICKKATEESLF